MCTSAATGLFSTIWDCGSRLTVRFTTGGARLSVLLHCSRGGGCAFVATLTGYAYQTIAGKSILAGQTSGAEDDPAMKPEDTGPAASVNDPVLETPRSMSLGGRTLGA
jgi:hypothetical protein